MRNFIIVLSVLLCFVSSQAWAFPPGFIAGVTASAPAAPAFTGLLYVDFNDETSDAQIDATPTGWNDDYTTTVLEGVHSAFSEGNDSVAEARIAKWNFTPTADTTVYARVAFRISSYPVSIATFAFGVSLSDSAPAVIADLYFSAGGGVTSLMSLKEKGADTTVVDPADTSAFSGGTYYLFITYDDGVAISADIRDSNFDVVSGWEVTNAVTQTDDPASISLYVYRINTDIIWDTLEVRHDTNWGN